jgi:hypothetical protein
MFLVVPVGKGRLYKILYVSVLLLADAIRLGSVLFG